MTEQFDAEQFLRSLPDHLDRFYKCADELAAAKARIAELEQRCKELNDLSDAIAERELGKRLYEALELVSGVIDGTKYPAIQRAVEETLNDYEKERK